MKGKVLVVDDERDQCWIFINIMQEQGYMVKTAMTAKSSVEIAKNEDFELAFIDAKLPDMDGIELSKKIKTMLPDIRIVLISGFYYEDDSLIKEGIELGLYSAFMAKPYRIDDVKLLAERLLEEGCRDS